MNGKITAVIDGQWGSTGKGNIVAKIANEFDAHVRVGSPNAGHSYKWNGETSVRQIIPVGHINLQAVLVIGRGALINTRILQKEIDEIQKHDPSIRDRLLIDERAGILSPWHEQSENHTEGELHSRIGSTGEGVGAARIDRLRRDPDKFQFFGEIAEEECFEDLVAYDTPGYLHAMYTGGRNILLEGAQGSGLGLIHGNKWPYCTTTECGSAQLASDIGIPPQRISETILVLRTYPIRVAGNSGPLPGEITWEELSNRLGRDVSERTTVTKKVRRVAEWSDDVVRDAIILNAPTSLAINFIDYINSDDAGVDQFSKLSGKSRAFIERVEDRHGVPVRFVGTGGPVWTVIDRWNEN